MWILIDWMLCRTVDWKEVCVCVPMFASHVYSQTDYLRGLQGSIRIWVLVTLIVAEGAIIQRAPATAELFMTNNI